MTPSSRIPTADQTTTFSKPASLRAKSLRWRPRLAPGIAALTITSFDMPHERVRQYSLAKPGSRFGKINLSEKLLAGNSAEGLTLERLQDLILLFDEKRPYLTPLITGATGMTPVHAKVDRDRAFHGFDHVQE